MSRFRPRLIITPGEPAGIGPELALQLKHKNYNADLFFSADPILLKQTMVRLNLNLDIVTCTPQSLPDKNQPGKLYVIPETLRTDVKPGHLDATNSPYVVKTLKTATDACLDKQFDALVTGPVHKGIINQSNIPFTGHTEFLEQRCGAKAVMLLQAPKLSVALVTTHIPLAKVSSQITETRLSDVINILHHSLIQRLGIKHPRIMVCGLNPHAGDNGALGSEEEEIIRPVIARYQRRGMEIFGPYSADTLFIKDNLLPTDVILAMYHDQGLPVLKTLGFGQAVNISLGLPIIRVSVDHGVALDRVGTGTASLASFDRAIQVAIEMSHTRFLHNTDCQQLDSKNAH